MKGHLSSRFARTAPRAVAKCVRPDKACGAPVLLPPGLIQSADAPWSAASVARGCVSTSGHTLQGVFLFHGARFQGNPEADARAGAPHGALREGGDSAEEKEARKHEATV